MLRRIYNECVGQHQKNVEMDMAMIREAADRHGIEYVEKQAVEHPNFLAKKTVDVLKARALDTKRFTSDGLSENRGGISFIAARVPHVTEHAIDALREVFEADSDYSSRNFYHSLSYIGSASKHRHTLPWNSGHVTTKDEDYHKITETTINKLFQYAREDNFPDALDSNLEFIMENKPGYFYQAKDLLLESGLDQEKEDEILRRMELKALKGLHQAYRTSSFNNLNTDPAFKGEDTMFSFAKKSKFFADHEYYANPYNSGLPHGTTLELTQ